MELNKRKIEGFVWAVEKWFSIVFLGAILLIISGTCSKSYGNFYPWEFAAGGIWIGYCNWRRVIKG